MRSDRTTRSRLALAVLVIAAGAFAASHLVLESFVRRVERDVARYPWGKEEYAQLVTPSAWCGYDGRRILLCGPSEAREAFRVELFEARFPDADVLSSAQSWGTLDDFRLMLEYVEQAYGGDALPDDVVLGVTPRWLSGLGLDRSPTVYVIDEMSSSFEVALADSGPELEEREGLSSLVAAAVHRTSQGARYRGGFWGAARATLAWAGSELAQHPGLVDRLDPYRFDGRRPRSEQHVRAFVDSPRGLYVDLQAWDPRGSEAGVRERFERVRRLCDGVGIRLWIVALPLRPDVGGYFRDGRLASYRDVLQRVVEPYPVLDLTDALSDEEFFDVVHPNADGGRRVTQTVCDWIGGRGPQSWAQKQPEVAR